MNKPLFDVIEETRKNLDKQLDKESERYLDRTILERKLDGKHTKQINKKHLNAKNINFCLVLQRSSLGGDDSRPSESNQRENVRSTNRVLQKLH